MIAAITIELMCLFNVQLRLEHVTLYGEVSSVNEITEYDSQFRSYWIQQFTKIIKTFRKFLYLPDIF